MIEYSSGDASLLDEVAPLWEKLRSHHVSLATHFAADLAATAFGDRKKGLLAKAGTAGVRVDLATDDQGGSCVGYCISSVDASKGGEVESLYVEAEYRGRGLGDALMQTALGWLRKQDVRSIIIGVAAGNEEAIGFYARFGFHPRAVVLAQPKNREG